MAVSDLELLKDFQCNGSGESFREIVERHCDLVYGVACRILKDSEHARDVTQEVFSRLAQKPLSAGSIPLAVWLHRNTRNLAVDLVRNLEARRKREARFHTLYHMHQEPEPQWGDVEPWIDEMVDSLPERDRNAVILRFYHKQSYRAIAETMKDTEEAVRKRLNRALERLRLMLAKRGIQTSAAALSALLPAHTTTPVPIKVLGSVLAKIAVPAVGSATSVPSFILMTLKQKLVWTCLLGVGAISITAFYFREQGNAVQSKVEKPRESQVTPDQNRGSTRDVPKNSSDHSGDTGGRLFGKISEGRKTIKKLEGRLVDEYGESKARQAKHLTEKTSKILDSVLAITRKMKSKDQSAEIFSELEKLEKGAGKSMELTEGQKQAIREASKKAAQKQIAMLEEKVKRIKENPEKLEESFLAHDAFKSGQIDRGRFDEIWKRTNFENSTISIGSPGFESALADPILRDELAAVLTPEQLSMLDAVKVVSRDEDRDAPPPDREVKTLEQREKETEAGIRATQAIIDMLEMNGEG